MAEAIAEMGANTELDANSKLNTNSKVDSSSQKDATSTGSDINNVNTIIENNAASEPDAFINKDDNIDMASPIKDDVITKDNNIFNGDAAVKKDATNIEDNIINPEATLKGDDIEAGASAIVDATIESGIVEMDSNEAATNRTVDVTDDVNNLDDDNTIDEDISLLDDMDANEAIKRELTTYTIFGQTASIEFTEEDIAMATLPLERYMEHTRNGCSKPSCISALNRNITLEDSELKMTAKDDDGTKKNETNALAGTFCKKAALKGKGVGKTQKKADKKGAKKERAQREESQTIIKVAETGNGNLPISEEDMKKVVLKLQKKYRKAQRDMCTHCKNQGVTRINTTLKLGEKDKEFKMQMYLVDLVNLAIDEMPAIPSKYLN